MKIDYTELAEEFIGMSSEKPAPGEIIDRVQLAEQLKNCVPDWAWMPQDVENVALEIERLSLG